MGIKPATLWSRVKGSIQYTMARGKHIYHVLNHKGGIPLSLQDSIYFVEGRRDEDIDDKLVSMVMVRCLMEALPETRFHRLLHKKQFDEAEKFAKLFNLNIEVS